MQGCVTGRRFIQDKSAEYKTLIIGGVKDKRLKAEEYERSIEVMDSVGKSECDHPLKTEKREGASGGYLASGGSLSFQFITLSHLFSNTHFCSVMEVLPRIFHSLSIV